MEKQVSKKIKRVGKDFSQLKYKDMKQWDELYTDSESVRAREWKGGERGKRERGEKYWFAGLYILYVFS